MADTTQPKNQTRRGHHGKRYTEGAWALQVDENKLKGHVDEVVRSSVEETLNVLQDAEGRRDLPGAALRALTGSGGHSSRPLRA